MQLRKELLTILGNIIVILRMVLCLESEVCHDKDDGKLKYAL